MSRNLLCVMAVAILVSLLNLNYSQDGINGLLTGIPVGLLLAGLELRAVEKE